MREVVGRLTILLLALALGLGVVLDSARATQMDAEMATVAASAVPMLSHCDGCGGGDHADMSPSACSALCGGAAAVSCAGLHANVAVPAHWSPSVATTRTGHAGPPDPYPPRPSRPS
jgi:hypothetical protein